MNKTTLFITPGEKPVLNRVPQIGLCGLLILQRRWHHSESYTHKGRGKGYKIVTKAVR